MLWELWVGVYKCELHAKFCQKMTDVSCNCKVLLKKMVYVDPYWADFFWFFLYTLLSLLGSLGRLTWVRLQQHQEQNYPVLQVHAGSVCVSVNHWTLTMDYRIFNVHTWSFLCMRIHTGVGHTNNESSQHNIFDSDKTVTNFQCAPDRVWTSGLCMSSPMLYQLSHPTMSSSYRLISSDVRWHIRDKLATQMECDKFW